MSSAFAGQQIAQSAASDGAAPSAAVNEEEVRGPHASLAVRLQVCSSLVIIVPFARRNLCCRLCLQLSFPGFILQKDEPGHTSVLVKRLACVGRQSSSGIHVSQTRPRFCVQDWPELDKFLLSFAEGERLMTMLDPLAEAGSCQNMCAW